MPTTLMATDAPAPEFSTRSPDGTPSQLPFETISVVGLGYIGLPTAAIFAGRRVQVLGLDVNRKAVDTINRGEIHIAEPDLDIVVRAVVSEGWLRASTVAEPADAFLIAVPTPFKAGETDAHEPDLSYVEAASRSIAPVLKPGDLVVLESTSPVGTTERMADWLAEARPDLTFPRTHGEASDIRIAHCPERVLPGHVLRELVQNDRVIGGMTPRCSARAVELYKHGRPGRVHRHQPAHRRDGQAHREQLPRRQHRLRQRALHDLRRARHRRLGADPAGQPPSAGQHPAARPRRRRALHRGRPLVHRLPDARGGPPDPHRARGQRRQARTGWWSG